MYDTINEGCTIMVNNIQEEEFFLSHLKPHHDVLEWGLGCSTIEIAKRVNSVVSIEYNENYFHDMQPKLPDNAKAHLVQLNKDPRPEYSDGTYLDCKDYIEFPKTLNKKFDIIFIDGRARVSCARVACMLLKEGGAIFIHDYHHWKPEYVRHEYYRVEKFLDRVNGSYAMWKFKPKQKNGRPGR